MKSKNSYSGENLFKSVGLKSVKTADTFLQEV